MDVSQAYKYIENIITYGFLSVGIDVYGLYMVLKNMTDKETKNLPLYVNEKNGTKALLYKLCFSTLSICGESFLKDRDRKLDRILSFYNETTSVFVYKVIDIIKELNELYLESTNYLEGFCYTPRSRNLWKIWKTHNNFLGFSGTTDIGINNVQENWIIINEHLDDEERYEKDFNLSILVASSFNGKGARQVSKNYERSRNELKELREEIAKFGYDKKRVEEQTKKDRWTAPLKSREDLVRELYRQMRGEKDQHDLFIDKWTERQREKADRARKEAEEKKKQYRKKFEQLDMSQLEGSRPVTADELDKILKSKTKTTSKYMSAYQHHEDRDKFIKKISARVIRGTEG